MKHALRLAFLIAIYFLLPSTSFAQKASYDHAFATIDSLAANQKVKLALELVTQVNLRARNEGNTTMVIKSVMYRRLFQSYLDGNDVIAQIHLLRKDVLLAKQPEKSMLQSLLAASLWNYYSRNAYKISQRSEVAGDIGDDVATWPVQKILAEVTALSIASIAEVSLLQNTSLDALDAILIGDKSTRYLRPNLYDLLAYDALPIFRDKRLYITSSLTENEDTASKMATKIFENMLVYHRKKGNTGAYFDGALAQLKYFRKDLYDTTANLSYLNALNALIKESQRTEVYSDILYEIARLYKQGAVKVEEQVNPQRKAFDLAEEAIRAYPKSSGASSAAALIEEIKSLQLSLKIRGFVLPGHVVDVLYRYQNIDSLHLQLYKLSNHERGLNLWLPASYKRFILRNKPVKAWFKTTPNAGDYRQHVLKDSIEGLPSGDYVLIAQNKPILDTLNGQLITQFISFKVSNLIVAARNGFRDRQFMVFESLNG